MPWFADERTIGTPPGPQTMSIRQGDRLPAFAAVLRDRLGAPLDLTDSTCFLELRAMSAPASSPALLASVECIIESPASGLISYDWQEVQTLGTDVGVYDVTVRVVYDSGRVVTVPSGDQETTVNVRSDPNPLVFVID